MDEITAILNYMEHLHEIGFDWTALSGRVENVRSEGVASL